MHIAAGESDFSHGSIEVFIFKLADFATVHCVSPISAETLHIKLVCALPYFLIGVKSYAHIAVLDFGMLHEVLHGRDDFGDAGLVVSTEKRIAIGYNKILPLVMLKFRKLRW